MTQALIVEFRTSRTFAETSAAASVDHARAVRETERGCRSRVAP